MLLTTINNNDLIILDNKTHQTTLNANKKENGGYVILDESRALKIFAEQIRLETIRAIGSFGGGHIGGALSIADVLAVLYGAEMNIDPSDPGKHDRDWLVLSKGHCGPSLYATLALKGYFDTRELSTLNQNNTRLPSHCDRNKTPGIDVTTGSLGQGASSAAGVALGCKLKGLKNYVYLILGDGECNEGQVWEMAMFANHHKLDNLIAFIDLNHQQLDGNTKDICDLGALEDKFSSFGWYSQKINGNDIDEILKAIKRAKESKGVPSMIVLDTVKGKGWSLVEGKPKVHHLSFSKEQIEAGVLELEDVIAELQN